MLASAAVTAIRSETNHDGDTQFTDTQLYVVIGAEWLRLRRWVEGLFPALCRFTGTYVVATGATGILKSAITNFDKIDLVERLSGTSNYYPMMPKPRGASDCCVESLSFDETANSIAIYPEADAPGSYRVTYLSANSGATISTTDLNDMTAAVSGIPLGLEQVLIHRIAAWAYQRTEELNKIPYQLEIANSIMEEFLLAHRNRFGQMPTPGMVRTRR